MDARDDAVYMDNAATSWPKPPSVVEAMAWYQEEVGASAGRGGYRRLRASYSTPAGRWRSCSASRIAAG
jgi:selenocysteine lyase/cysteine desulfurase